MKRTSLLVFPVLAATFHATARASEFETLRRFPAPSEGQTSGAGPLFRATDAAESGLGFRIPIDTTHPDKRLYYSAMACGAVAVGDLDGDLWPDLFFSAGAVPNRLFRNRGEHTTPRFEEVDAGVAEAGSWCTGAAMCDVDGDGDLDLFVCRYDEPNRLFINESQPGTFRFREAAEAWGVALADASLMPVIADYDNDGDPDLFLAANALYRKGGRPPGGVPMRKTETAWEVVPPYDRYFTIGSIDPTTGVPTFMETARPNRLFRNDGTRFTEVSMSAGLLGAKNHTNGAAWIDYDHDGRLDLYVGNDFADRDELYRNRGDGTFEEVAAAALQHTTWFSMGAGTGDYNNDGLTDLVVADMLPTTHYRQKVSMGAMGASFAEMYRAGLPRQNMVNAFFVNTGTGHFLEAAHLSGISKSDWTWAVKRADFDGDGRLDLYFPTGHTRDFNHSDYKKVAPQDRVGHEDWEFFESRPELREHDLAFRNTADWHFEKAGDAWGLGLAETMTYGAAVSDIDRDGDLDLVTLPLEDPPTLFLNQSRERAASRHLLVELRGRNADTRGIGARVTVEMSDGRRIPRSLLPYNGYQESDEPILHFGLGKADSIAAVEVVWPGGKRQKVTGIDSDQWIRIIEADSGETEEAEMGPTPLFERIPGFSQLAPREKDFDDFARQPLLPHRHSQLGPGQAWGDADGDGRPDLYLGGPNGANGKLLLQRDPDAAGQPTFVLRTDGLPDSINFEDLGSLFFDADGDGDLDLFVVSGSVECKPGDETLRNRLYFNDGTGRFEEAADHLPDPGESGHASGSVAAAADFDRDGDLDVFVGGRVVPGQYPVAAVNRLLLNDGNGRFTHGASANGLEKTGLVTAALWSDCDGDGWLDLIVAHEWGSVRVFKNEGGKLVDRTEEAGLSRATGFWNSIAGRDFDGDGDIDYLAGNLGHNTKYHATAEAPELLYYGDLSGSGRYNLVEAKIDSSKDCLLPRRGLSCSSLAMPPLLEKVNTYHGWASSTLDQIYEKARIEKALRFEATTLDSVLLRNDGEGRFAIEPLATLAQIAPVFGIALGDFDGDGHTDAALAQNFLTPQQETGPYDGGLGLFLRGGKDGNFTEVWPRESGIVVPGDGKSLALTDFDGDGWPDLFFGINNAPPAILMNRGAKRGGGRPLVVKLAGRAGNPTAIGARVRVSVPGLPPQTAEVAAGSGYLTQGPPELYFGWGTGSPESAEVEVRWPDGEVSRTNLSRSEGPVHAISQP